MNRADELLRRLFNEAFMAETIEECREYLNEKPPECERAASPPHAAAELEKPMGYPPNIDRFVEYVREWKGGTVKLDKAETLAVLEELLRRASPSAQPIARVEKFYCCPECGYDTWLQHAADCSALKSAGKEST